MRRKYRVGKNSRGWFLAIPRAWGHYDVIEGLPSWGAAMGLLDHHSGRGIW